MFHYYRLLAWVKRLYSGVVETWPGMEKGPVFQRKDAEIRKDRKEEDTLSIVRGKRQGDVVIWGVARHLLAGELLWVRLAF
jgi:hypothetical protein